MATAPAAETAESTPGPAATESTATTVDAATESTTTEPDAAPTGIAGPADVQHDNNQHRSVDHLDGGVT